MEVGELAQISIGASVDAHGYDAHEQTRWRDSAHASATWGWWSGGQVKAEIHDRLDQVCPPIHSEVWVAVWSSQPIALWRIIAAVDCCPSHGVGSNQRSHRFYQGCLSCRLQEALIYLHWWFEAGYRWLQWVDISAAPGLVVRPPIH